MAHFCSLPRWLKFVFCFFVCHLKFARLSTYQRKVILLTLRVEIPNNRIQI